MITSEQFLTLRAASKAANKLHKDSQTHHLFLEFRSAKVRYAVKNPIFSTVTDWIPRDACECGIEDWKYCLDNAFKVKEIANEMAKNPGKSYDLFKGWMDAPTMTRLLPNFDALLKCDGQRTNTYFPEHLAIFVDAACSVHDEKTFVYVFKPGYVHTHSDTNNTQVSHYTVMRSAGAAQAVLFSDRFHAVLPFIEDRHGFATSVTIHEDVHAVIFHVSGISFLVMPHATNLPIPTRFNQEFSAHRIKFNGIDYGIELHPSSPANIVEFVNVAARSDHSLFEMTVYNRLVPQPTYIDDAHEWTDETLSLELRLKGGTL
jgi:hypothetical protein